MMTLSHLCFGALATALITKSTDPMVLLAGSMAALLPDADISFSPSGQVLGVISKILTLGKFSISEWMEKHFPHRGVTHSIFIAGGIYVVCYLLALRGYLTQELVLAIAYGYFLGGVAPDLVTVSGAAVFWPLDNAPWAFPGNGDFRLKTGSKIEWFIFTALLLVLLWVFSANNVGGVGRVITNLIGSSAGVEQVFNTSGANKIILVDVEGTYAIDRQPVKRQFRLITQHGQGFLVADENDNIIKVGGDGSSQILTTRISAKESNTAQTIIKSIDLNDQQLIPVLGTINNAYPTAIGIYLTGNISIDAPEEVTIPSDPRLFPTIQLSEGGNVTLESAPLKQVARNLGDQWITGQLLTRAILVNNSNPKS